ncbi:MAG: calcium-translocating P-type ATPase, PMCA-type [Candidatus Micrarchaeota archaeon]|nr:calcium-translocating P-type ATPase, PMCA-type [Candidatus Micrarchaeota archaeon]
MKQTEWHSASLSSIFASFGTSERGLSEKQVAEHKRRYGENAIIEAKKDPWFVKFLGQFKSLPILLLLAAAGISFALGLTIDQEKLLDAFAISAAILIAVLFSYWQEHKAEAALEALKKMVVQRCVVVRSGKEQVVDSKELVPGDVVVLEEGAKVPADIRIIESTNLAADQSALTGESRPSSKEPCTCPSKTLLPERRNMLFAGTVIVRGHCKGVVVATGMHTEFGKIVGFVSEEKKAEAPLQRNINNLSKTLGYAGIAAAFLFFVYGLVRAEEIVHMFVVAVTLAVAVIPEGLPTVLAVTLAIGVQQMARHNAIVRKMTAVEALGSATVICTDKTGTITQNKMVVQEIVLPRRTYNIGQGSLDSNAAHRDTQLLKAVEIMALCNNAMRVMEEGRETLKGDPTEAALLSAVEKCGADERSLRLQHRQVGEIPFDSDRKMMSSIRLYKKERQALVKGAPEKVLPRCTKILLQNGERKMDSKWRSRFESEYRSLAFLGMRVLALAYRPVGKMKKYSPSTTERGLVFVGLVAMEDPPRPEVADAISSCHMAGIKVIMITGDSMQTAKAIAAKVGLWRHGDRIVDSTELEAMNDAELENALASTTIFARTTPEQKYRIVNALMKRGEIVAVTGDGVNDAPAIKKADIGVAMGLTGTDVSKEVADVVLTDDNFASIVNAVKYGRTIFNNIKSFVRYQISTNVGALLLMFSAPILQLPLPLAPLQLLWINIMIDGPPAVSLGLEPPSQQEMKKPPRNPKAGILTFNLVVSILLLGSIMASLSIALFGYYLSFEPAKATTAVFTLFVFLQLLNALNCRSSSESILARPFSNPYLYSAIALSFLLHMAILFLPQAQQVFKTVPLEASDLLFIGATASVIVAVEEMKKKFLPYTTNY